jgi:hypothetical protein
MTTISSINVNALRPVRREAVFIGQEVSGLCGRVDFTQDASHSRSW